MAEGFKIKTDERIEAMQSAVAEVEESIKQKVEIRAHIEDLEREWAHPEPGARKKENPEQEILKLEEELRALETGKENVQSEELDAKAEEREKEKDEERTLAEKREELKKVVEELESKNEFVKEINNEIVEEPILEAKGLEEEEGANVENLEKILEDRSKELDAKAEEMGMTEKVFRKLGEGYNNLSKREKIMLGGFLAVSTGAASFLALPTALTMCVGGLAAQRSAGLSSMFLKYEKSMTEGKWRKEKAMAKAIGTQTLMTGGMLLAIEGVKEGFEWLAHHWPNGDNVIENMSHAPIAPMKAGLETHTSELAPEQVSVEASPGHGYEWMVKRLWEQLQEKDIDPSKFNPDSDVYKLLTADDKTIDGVVHRIAMDSKHGFFNADGTSVLIKPDEHLSILPSGEIGITNATNDTMYVHAPEGAAVTPAYTPEAPEGETPHAPFEPAQRDNSPEAIQRFTEAQQTIEEPFQKAPAIPAEAPTAPDDIVIDNSDLKPAVVTLPELEQVSESTVNDFGLEIQEDVPHIYAGAGGKELFIYGGQSDAQAKMIESYLKEHPKDTIVGAFTDGASRVKYSLGPNGKVAEELLAKQSFWSRLFSGTLFENAPKPEEFQKLIK